MTEEVDVQQGASSDDVTVNAGGIEYDIPEEFKVNDYGEIISELERRREAFTPLTPEQLKKLRRRQRAEGIVSGIADAAQAVSNLWFTSQYAPNMYDGKGSMSERARQRFDKAKAERDAKDDAYYNFSMNIAKLKAADRARGLQLWQTEQAQKRQQLQDQHQANLRPLELGKAQSEASIKQTEAKYAEGFYGGRAEEAGEKVNTEKSRQSSYNAQAVASYARANASRAEAGGKTIVLHADKDYSYSTPQEYDAAVRAKVREWNKEHPNDQIEDQIDSGNKDAYGRPEWRDATTAELAGGLEDCWRAERAKKSAKKSPTGGGKKSPTG